MKPNKSIVGVHSHLSLVAALLILSSALIANAGCPVCDYITSVPGPGGTTRCDLNGEARICDLPTTSEVVCFTNETPTNFTGSFYMVDVITMEWHYFGPCQESIYECYTNDTMCY